MFDKFFEKSRAKSRTKAAQKADSAFYMKFQSLMGKHIRQGNMSFHTRVLDEGTVAFELADVRELAAGNNEGLVRGYWSKSDPDTVNIESSGVPGIPVGFGRSSLFEKAICAAMAESAEKQGDEQYPAYETTASSLSFETRSPNLQGIEAMFRQLNPEIYRLSRICNDAIEMKLCFNENGTTDVFAFDHSGKEALGLDSPLCLHARTKDEYDKSFHVEVAGGPIWGGLEGETIGGSVLADAVVAPAMDRVSRGENSHKDIRLLMKLESDRGLPLFHHRNNEKIRGCLPQTDESFRAEKGWQEMGLD